MAGDQKIIPLTQVKRNFLGIIKEIVDEDSTVMVTKNGAAAAVMMTPERYEGLLETIEILGDQKTIKALAASKKDFEAGRVHDHSDVWAE